MSALVNFLKIQFILKAITDEQLKTLIGKKITQIEYETIIKGECIK